MGIFKPRMVDIGAIQHTSWGSAVNNLLNQQNVNTNTEFKMLDEQRRSTNAAVGRHNSLKNQANHREKNIAASILNRDDTFANKSNAIKNANISPIVKRLSFQELTNTDKARTNQFLQERAANQKFDVINTREQHKSNQRDVFNNLLDLDSPTKTPQVVDAFKGVYDNATVNGALKEYGAFQIRKAAKEQALTTSQGLHDKDQFAEFALNSPGRLTPNKVKGYFNSTGKEASNTFKFDVTGAVKKSEHILKQASDKSARALQKAVAKASKDKASKISKVRANILKSLNTTKKNDDLPGIFTNNSVKNFDARIGEIAKSGNLFLLQKIYHSLQVENQSSSYLSSDINLNNLIDRNYNN